MSELESYSCPHHVAQLMHKQCGLSAHQQAATGLEITAGSAGAEACSSCRRREVPADVLDVCSWDSMCSWRAVDIHTLAALSTAAVCSPKEAETPESPLASSRLAVEQQTAASSHLRTAGNTAIMQVGM